MVPGANAANRGIKIIDYSRGVQSTFPTRLADRAAGIDFPLSKNIVVEATSRVGLVDLDQVGSEPEARLSKPQSIDTLDLLADSSLRIRVYHDLDYAHEDYCITPCRSDGTVDAIEETPVLSRDFDEPRPLCNGCKIGLDTTSKVWMIDWNQVTHPLLEPCKG